MTIFENSGQFSREKAPDVTRDTKDTTDEQININTARKEMYKDFEARDREAFSALDSETLQVMEEVMGMGFEKVENGQRYLNVDPEMAKCAMRALKGILDDRDMQEKIKEPGDKLAA